MPPSAYSRQGFGIAVGAALMALAVAVPRSAVAAEGILTPRSMGISGAVRANATGALGPLVNPSGMPLVRQYALEAFYGFDVQSLGHLVHISIADSVTSRLAAGLYYTYVHSTPRVRYTPDASPDKVVREGHETGLSLALPIGNYFSLGLTSKYIHNNTTVANPTCDPTIPDTCQRITLDSTTSRAAADGFSIDFGITARLGSSVSFGVIGYNLVPLRSVEAPMALGMGLGYQWGQSLLVELDGVVYFDRFHKPGTTSPEGKHVEGKALTTGLVAFGLEYLIIGHIPIRGGVSYDTGLPGTFLTLGTGYVGSKFAVEVGYRQKVQGGIDSELAAGVRVFLQ